MTILPLLRIALQFGPTSFPTVNTMQQPRSTRMRQLDAFRTTHAHATATLPRHLSQPTFSTNVLPSPLPTTTHGLSTFMHNIRPTTNTLHTEFAGRSRELAFAHAVPRPSLRGEFFGCFRPHEPRLGRQAVLLATALPSKPTFMVTDGCQTIPLMHAYDRVDPKTRPWESLLQME